MPKCANTDDETIDPVLAAILEAIDRDIALHPETIKPMPAAVLQRMDDLVGDMDVDLDEPIEGDVGL